MKMALFKKSKKEDDLSVVNDYKEPFSWQNFWDEQIIARYKKIHDFLQENGVLYFLMSPFQYKNRLLLKLALIVVGVMIGIVPRTIQMVNSAKERNAGSEIANVKSGIMVNDIKITPMDSSQYKKTHLLVFNIAGSTSDGVPSTTSGFDVTLSTARGVTDEKNVKYQYKIVPVDQNNRLLLVYVNNKKQNDETGIYNLDVHVKKQAKMRTPMEIVLSNNQKTRLIYDNNKIDLSALSDKLTQQSGIDPHMISDAQKELNNQVKIYEENEKRLNESGMKIGMTTAKIKQYIKENTSMPSLTDKSTTTDLDGLKPRTGAPLQIESTIIDTDGKKYSDLDNSSEDATDLTSASSSVVNKAKDVELPNLSSYTSNVVSALGKLNNAKLSKYNALMTIESVLNQKITPDDMSAIKTVKD